METSHLLVPSLRASYAVFGVLPRQDAHVRAVEKFVGVGDCCAE